MEIENNFFEVELKLSLLDDKGWNFSAFHQKILNLHSSLGCLEDILNFLEILNIMIPFSESVQTKILEIMDSYPPNEWLQLVSPFINDGEAGQLAKNIMDVELHEKSNGISKNPIKVDSFDRPPPQNNQIQKKKLENNDFYRPVEKNLVKKPDEKKSFDSFAPLPGKNVALQKEGKVRPNDEVFELIKLVNASYSKEQLVSEVNQILQKAKSFSSFNKSDVKSWSENYKKNKKATFSERIAVICQAVKLWKNYFPRATQISSVVALALQSKRILAEIKTGEGKSIIVAMLAIEMALLGKTPDIVTSSEVLARRDSDEFSELYEYFGLKCQHNIVFELEEKEKLYKSDIIYGTAHSFEGDILQQIFYGRTTRGERKFNSIIVDEVDSMLLDGIHDCTYISSPIPAFMDSTIIIKAIWNRLMILSKCDKMGCLQRKDIKVELEKYVKSILEDKEKQFQNITINQESRDLIARNLSAWCENALRAFEMTENEEYVVEDDGIKIVDHKRTGVVLEKTIWQEGLHQFLELKHNKFVRCESLVSNWLSNLAFFKKYDVLMGLTGTFGSEACKKLLEEIYKVSFVMIPTFKEKVSIQYETLLAANQQEWYKMMMNSVKDIIKQGRSILIINETISVVEELQRILSGIGSEILMYTRSDKENQKDQLFKSDLKARTIVIATNLAGRGTDIKLSKELVEKGGLHVIVTYLAANSRVLDQAFGRASRQGQPGSCQLILRQDMVINQYGHAFPSELLPVVMDTMEEMTWKDMKVRMEKYEKKDELFQMHINFMNEIIQDKSKPENQAIMKEINGEWAFFVKDMEQKNIPQYQADYQQFKKRIEDKYVVNENNKKKVNPMSMVNMDNLNAQAVAEINLQNNRNAEELARRALNFQPQNPISNFIMGAAMANQNRGQDAIPHFENVGRFAPLEIERREFAQALGLLSLPVEKVPKNGKVDLSTVLMKYLQKLSENCIHLIKTKNKDQKLTVDFNESLASFLEKQIGVDKINKEDKNEVDGKLRGNPVPKLEEIKKDSGWGWLGMVFLGLAQIVIGAVVSTVCPFLAGGLGIPMIIEGIKDIYTGIAAKIQGKDIDWGNYARQKALSYAMIVTTMPLSAGALETVNSVELKGMGFFSKFANNAKTALGEGSVLASIVLTNLVGGGLNQNPEQQVLKENFVEQAIEVGEKEIAKNPLIKNKDKILDTADKIIKELKKTVEADAPALVKQNSCLTDMIEHPEHMEKTKLNLREGLTIHFESQISNTYDEIKNLIGKKILKIDLCNFTNTFATIQGYFKKALKASIQMIYSEDEKKNGQVGNKKVSGANFFSKKYVECVEQNFNGKQLELQNESQNLDNLKRNLDSQFNQLQNIRTQINQTVDHQQKQNLIDNYNNLGRAYEGQVQSYNARLDQYGNNQQTHNKNVNHITSNIEKITPLFQNIIEVLISGKFIDENKKSLKSSNEIRQEIEKILNQQNILAIINSQERERIKESTMKSLQEFDNQNSEYNKSCKLLTQEILGTLDSLIKKFVDQIIIAVIDS